MAHNTTLNPGVGGDPLSDYDLATAGSYLTTAGKVPSSTIWVSPNTSTAPAPVTPSNPFPVAATSLPLPTGASTAANQATEIAALASIITGLGNVAVTSSALPTGAATSALQTTGNTSLGTIATNTTGASTAALQTTGNTSLASILTAVQGPTPAGTNVMGKVGIDQTANGVAVVSNAFISAPTVTRPANQTPYTAGDVVGGAITFSTVGPNGGPVLITSASLRIDITAIPAGMTSFRLYLYDATPPSALADNAAWDLPSGDRANFLGYLDLGTPADLGSTLYCQVTSPGLQTKLNASTSLFGYLVTNGGFTPAANSEVYNPKLATVGV